MSDQVSNHNKSNTSRFVAERRIPSLTDSCIHDNRGIEKVRPDARAPASSTLYVYIAGDYILDWADAKEWAHAYSSNVSEIEFVEKDPNDDLLSNDIDYHFWKRGWRKEVDCRMVTRGDERKVFFITHHRDVSKENFNRHKRKCFIFAEDETALRWKKEWRFEELGFADKVRFVTVIDPNRVGFWRREVVPA